MLNSSLMKRKRRTLVMDALQNTFINTCEFIKDRLYFATRNPLEDPKTLPNVHCFHIDFELKYENFYLDFGPLNLAMLYHYCVKLKRKLNNPAFQDKKIVHYTENVWEKRANAAFLIGSYSIIYLNFEPEKAYEILTKSSSKDYADFRDASIGEPYTISLLDCLKAIKKAHDYGFFNFEDFDCLEYEHYEKVENGDFNWIVPNKFIAFCGPHNKSKLDRGYPIHSPETYFAYFRRHKVTTIIRLNKKVYDSNRFVQAGFEHRDLYFVDGGTPSDRILNQFINICENAKGAIAVHCKAGLGRTGSLIACYIMKHYTFTAEEAIAWIRICRPGSIIGHQQTWLQEKQPSMWEAGEVYRKRHGLVGPPKHKHGIYAEPSRYKKKNVDNVSGIMKKVDCMEINDREEFLLDKHSLTQGDKLNEIKAQRCRVKPVCTNLSDIKEKVTITATPMTSTVLRGGKVLSASIKTSGSTSSRVLTKRIDTKDGQARRCSQRKVLTVTTNEKLQSEVKRPARKRESPWLTKNGISYQNGVTLRSEKLVVKRGKRSLTIEKDKQSPRSVKVLRRSHGLIKPSEKTEKIRLPSVKLKSI